MKCRYCGSSRIYRSHRRGLKERVWLRMVMMVPYRCHDCGARYTAPKSDISVARGGREYKIRQWVITLAMALIFLAVSIVFLIRAIDI